MPELRLRVAQATLAKLLAFSFNVPSWVDLANDFAAIPDDGNQHLVLTLSRCRAVRRCRLYLIGDRVTIDEFLHVAEEVKEVQFEKALRQYGDARGWSMQPRGEMDLPTEGSLNQRFPMLETLKIKEAVKLWFNQQV
ncbi:hypothetical protein B0T10DRAFT_467087 [Thelonectria olida]|uniref:Uncharacterized protein n=1 Tax=Thelonectria olida TaxID=1576542 RepID=A0A9P8VP69_9HYPO|nr:hypothetical protein B0T10DRAFT_467087 [Thelonectria olida]